MRKALIFVVRTLSRYGFLPKVLGKGLQVGYGNLRPRFVLWCKQEKNKA